MTTLYYTLLIALGLAFISLFPYSSSSHAYTSEHSILSADTVPDLEQAQAHFKNYCSGCHGEQMQAFVDRQWKYGNTKEDIAASITNGHPEQGMPSFKAVLSETEIGNLAAYILHGIENVDRYAFQDEVLASDTFQTETLEFSLDTMATGNLQNPWGMAFLPDGAMLITDRSGTLYHLSAKRTLQKVQGVPPVLAEGQGGLLDVILHPDFKNNQWIYLSYSKPKIEGSDTLATTAISRARIKGTQLREQKVIFEAQPYADTQHHYGSRLVFGTDGYLYFSVGDRGNRDENPQSLASHAGKIHRIKDDGSIPQDNPFVGKEEALPSIYSWGHRNPQGLAMHPETGVLWEHEHGPRGGDEVNIIRKGKNYGWPLISYGINYDGTTFTHQTEQEGMEQPVLYWVPSIAPSGMDFVTGNRYKGWEGNLLVGSLRFKYLNRCKVEGNKITVQEILMKNIGRIRNVKMGPDGYIYVAVEDPGAIYRLIPTENL